MIQYKGKTEEWVYNDLEKNYDVVEMDGGGYKLSPKDGKGDDIMPQGWASLNHQLNQLKSKPSKVKIDQQIGVECKSSRDIGQDSPSFVKDLLDKIKQSKVEWQDVLRRFIVAIILRIILSEEFIKDYHSYGMFAPSSEKIGVGDIVVAIDSAQFLKMN